MNVAALINPRSGSVPANAAQVLEAGCVDLGVECSVHVAGEASLADDIRAGLACAEDAFVVWGGDGTLACALDLSGPDGPPVLALPGGTMNLLPKRIHGADLTWQQALSGVLRAPRVLTLPAGIVDGRKFYIGALIGKLTRLVEPREAARKGDLLGAGRDLVAEGLLDLETALSFTALGGEASGEERSATAIGVFLDKAPPGRLEVGAIDPDSLLELARTGLEAMIEDWRAAEGLLLEVAERLQVRLLSGEVLNATLDGEPADLPASIEIRRIEDAARVLTMVRP